MSQRRRWTVVIFSRISEKGKLADLLKPRGLDLDELMLPVGQLHRRGVHRGRGAGLHGDLGGCLLVQPLPPDVGLLVVPQVGESLEGLAAVRAHVRPLARVRPPVLRQVHALDETLSAHLAAERPLARVRAQVLSQVRVLPEALAAHLAGERPLAGVDPLVEGDSGRRHKQFAADETLVGFGPLPGCAAAPREVAQFVEPQVGGRIELLPAKVTTLTPARDARVSRSGLCRGPFARLVGNFRSGGVLLQEVAVPLPPGQEAGPTMGTLERGRGPRVLSVAMGRQLGGPAKAGGAVRAAQQGGVGVQQAVLPQVGGLGEGAVADLTAERPHARVDEVVPHQVGKRREGFAAVGALEWPLAGVNADVVAHVHLLLERLAADATNKAALGGVGLAAMVKELQLGGKGLRARATGKGPFVGRRTDVGVARGSVVWSCVGFRGVCHLLGFTRWAFERGSRLNVIVFRERGQQVGRCFVGERILISRSLQDGECGERRSHWSRGLQE